MKKLGPIIAVALLIAAIAYILLGYVITTQLDYSTNETTTNETSDGYSEKTPVINDGTDDIDCGDGVCGVDETFNECNIDCAATCGDAIADDAENWKNCRHDLMAHCGNGLCDDWEHYRYCPNDCEECIVDDSNKYDGPDKCPISDRWVS